MANLGFQLTLCLRNGPKIGANCRAKPQKSDEFCFCRRRRRLVCSLSLYAVCSSLGRLFVAVCALPLVPLSPRTNTKYQISVGIWAHLHCARAANLATLDFWPGRADASMGRSMGPIWPQVTGGDIRSTIDIPRIAGPYSEARCSYSESRRARFGAPASERAAQTRNTERSRRTVFAPASYRSQTSRRSASSHFRSGPIKSSSASSSHKSQVTSCDSRLATREPNPLT